MTDRYNDVYAKLDGLPGVKMVGASTVQEGLPLVGDVSTITIQMARVDERDEDGHIASTKLVCFLTYQDADRAVRLVLPDRAVRTIARQERVLHNRSTPASRARNARRLVLEDRRAADHRAGKATHDPVKRTKAGLAPKMRGCPLCNV